MIGNTGSYSALKRSMEQQFDFVVLVCYSVPVLRRAIDATEATRPSLLLTPPDHFKDRRLSPPQLMGFAARYEGELARSLILGGFSYFEAYVKALIREFRIRSSMLISNKSVKLNGLAREMPPREHVDGSNVSP
jgi:hypothetical protein